jgi:hypothetical protein
MPSTWRASSSTVKLHVPPDAVESGVNVKFTASLMPSWLLGEMIGVLAVSSEANPARVLAVALCCETGKKPVAFGRGWPEKTKLLSNMSADSAILATSKVRRRENVLMVCIRIALLNLQKKLQIRKIRFILKKTKMVEFHSEKRRANPDISRCIS